MTVSPCISICRTDPVTGYCYGCGRSSEDKIKWKDPKRNKLKSYSLEKTKEWLLNPQITWLKENDIQSKEFVNIIEDNDLLELTELDRYKLIKNRLENSDIRKIKTTTKSTNFWKESYSGKGIFPPKASGLIE